MSTTQRVHGPRVPSWMVTETMLADWGFTVEKTDKIVGCKHVVQHGMRWNVAMTAAWAAGEVTMRSVPQWARDERAAAHRARMDAQHAAAVEMVAWCDANPDMVRGSKVAA